MNLKKPISKQVIEFSFWYSFQLLYTIKAVNYIAIDQGHLTKEPHCGSLPATTSARIANAIEAKTHYPWVVLVRRTNGYLESGQHSCGGAIITQNVVITAGHCVCRVDAKNRDKSEDIKEKLRCKGDYISVTNEITKDEYQRPINSIKVGAGNKNKDKLIEFDITFAIVYSKIPIDPSISNLDDLGLLKTDSGVNFYSQTDLKAAHFDIGPICLAAKNAELSDHNIATVGWGRRFSENLKENPKDGPKQNQHSCTTNQHGPMRHRFQHCDVDDLDEAFWDCKFKIEIMEEYPHGYDNEKCPDLIKKADATVKEAIANSGMDDLLYKWKDTFKIEIIEKNKDEILDFNNVKTCYKSKLFEERGWCIVKKNNLDTREDDQWGFCDTSCDIMKGYDPKTKIVGTTPEIYHEMVWKPDALFPRRCFDKDGDYRPWVMCINTLLPETSVFQFKLDQRGELNLYDVSREKPIEYLPRDENVGYQKPCKGDSGSGHWTFDTIREKAALVGITSFSGDIRKLETLVCGHSSHILKTTWPAFLKWIKQHSEIVN